MNRLMSFCTSSNQYLCIVLMKANIVLIKLHDGKLFLKVFHLINGRFETILIGQENLSCALGP